MCFGEKCKADEEKSGWLIWENQNSSKLWKIVGSKSEQRNMAFATGHCEEFRSWHSKAEKAYRTCHSSKIRVVDTFVRMEFKSWERWN